MSTVSPNQIATNAAITSSGVNTPINQLAAVINGGLDDSNVSSLSGTKIASGTTPAAAMATAANPETRGAELFFDHIASGLVWSGDSYGSTRNASMTAGVVYIAGKRVPVTAVSARTFTASRDTYVDVGDDGVVDYNEVTNNAASPTLAASHIRVAIIVTGASNIANVGSVNQGQEDKVVPIVSSVPYAVTDSIGNLICPRDPTRKILGARQILSDFNTSATAATQVTGLSCGVLAPIGRKIKVTVGGLSASSSQAGDQVNIGIWQGAVGSGTQRAWTILNTSNFGNPLVATRPFTPSSGSLTFNVALHNGTAARTASLNGNAASPAYLMVELV